MDAFPSQLLLATDTSCPPALGVSLIAQTSEAGAAATVDELAARFATLPLPSLVPAIILLLCGLLLIVAGRHFLRPVLVVTTILAGAVLGAPLLGLLIPGLGRIGLTLAGGLLGLVVVAATWRLMYGAASGIVLGFAASFVALLAVDAGLVDARVQTGSFSGGAATPAARLESGEVGADDEALRRTALLDRTPDAIRPLVDWADARWSAEPPQARMFLSAAAAGGAFIGFVIGAWLPHNCAAILTSLVGAILTLVGAAPLLARFTDRFSMPDRPLGWLLLWASLATAGWLLQTWRGDPDEPASPGRRPSLARGKPDASARDADASREG